MNIAIHLTSTLWGALAVQALALAAGLLFLGRGRVGSGVPVLAALAVAGMAASHWLPWVPGLAPQWPSLAFLGALLLPAVVLLQLEHEAGQPVNGWRKAAVLAGAFLPALLLPAQIVGQSICLLPGQCGPAAPFIVLLHLGTAGLLILLSLPALGHIARRRSAAGRRRPALSTGGLLITISLMHLFGLLFSLGMPAADALRWELAQAIVQLLLMQALALVSLSPWLRPAVTVAAAPEGAAQATPDTPAEVSEPADAQPIAEKTDAAACTHTSTDGHAQAAPTLGAPATEPLPESLIALHLVEQPALQALADTAPDTLAPGRSPLGDQVALGRIGQRALQMLRDEALYRQPQLRRKDLADKLQVPEYLLSRALNASQGMSFIDIVNGLRLSEAKQRLEHGHEPITTIAYDVGFNSQASFNRAFRDDTGASPSEFRQARQSPAAHPLALPVHARAA